MTAPAVAFRQEIAAPAAAPLDRLRDLLLERQREDGQWTDEWSPATAMAGPVGVTADAVIALLDAGTPADSPAVTNAVVWLWGRTVAPAAADPDPPEAESLAALRAFLRTGRVDRTTPAIANAVAALRQLQYDDGGWALTRDGRPEPPASSPETTGDVLTAFGWSGFGLEDPAVRAAVAYLEREQEPDSGWRGIMRPTLRATAAVLAGLRSVGLDPRALPVRRAVEWVKRDQLAGGSWAGPNGPDGSATAFAIRGLLAGGADGAEVAAGIAWLAANPPDGSDLAALIGAISAAGQRRTTAVSAQAG